MNRIFINDWLQRKPYLEQTQTDSYYLKVANDVKKKIVTHPQAKEIENLLIEGYIDFLAIFLTSYLEDLISETQIWNTFTKKHQELYKNHIPFYSIDEYYEGEINVQDVAFLIWYFLDSTVHDRFVHPEFEFIMNIATSVMEVFEEVWEYAPENTTLKDFYRIDGDIEDYYFARAFIDAILFSTYLFLPDTGERLLLGTSEIIEARADDDKLLMILNEFRDRSLYNMHTRLLGLSGKEWVAALLGESHPLSKHYLDISPKITGLFLYKGQDELSVSVEHIASGRKFEVTKKSYHHADVLTEIDTIVFLGITKWKDEWWFSGISFEQPYSTKVVEKEKKLIESLASVSFLEFEENDPKKHLNKQLEVFKNMNNGFPIAFIRTIDEQDFHRHFVENFNESLKLWPKNRKKITSFIDEGYLNNLKENWTNSRDIDPVTVFFNPNGGIEFAYDIESAFPLPNNPFFDPEEADWHLEELLITKEYSKELVLYCFEHCKDIKPNLEFVIGKVTDNEFDFLLRHWKQENYFTKPSISYKGTR